MHGAFYDTKTSEEIWKQFIAGEQEALDIIVRRHFNFLYKYGKKFSHDDELIKDCIQDMFLYLWNSRVKIGETFSVKNYLIKSLRRRLLAASKDKWRLAKGTSVFDDLSLIMHGDSLEINLISRESQLELKNKILTFLDNLSAKQQEIIYLRYYLDADANQIAKIMQLRRQSVYNLLSESLLRLKKLSDAPTA